MLQRFLCPTKRCVLLGRTFLLHERWILLWGWQVRSWRGGVLLRWLRILSRWTDLHSERQLPRFFRFRSRSSIQDVASCCCYISCNGLNHVGYVLWIQERPGGGKIDNPLLSSMEDIMTQRQEFCQGWERLLRIIKCQNDFQLFVIYNHEFSRSR
jgi:hypothetical protein